MPRPHPSFAEEKYLWDQGYLSVVGVDEVGRGAFAGPLVVGAVVFPPYCTFSDKELYDINDSKVLSAKKRIVLTEKIKLAALMYAIAEIPLSYINAHGIGKATQQGFYKSITSLASAPDYCLSDAFLIQKIPQSMQKPIIRGDSLSFSIAAASIIAKTYRDELMTNLHHKAPEYHFAKNKGYGTKHHRDMLRKHGLSPFHRLSFDLRTYLN